MRNLSCCWRPTLWVGSATAIALVGAGLLGSPIQAEDSLRQATSLKFVPADAAVYVAQLRNKQQLNSLLQSRAFARLMEIPAMQMATFVLRAQWNNPDNEVLTALRNWLEQEENRSLIELVEDALSNEVFFYGGADYASQFGLLARLSRAVNLVQLEAMATGADPEDVIARRILEILADSADEFRFANTLVGGRVSDTARAEAQLARLEALLIEVLDEYPELKGRLSRDTLGDAEFLTLRLDGELIPWDRIPTGELEIDTETLDNLLAKVKRMTLTISLGVRDDYLLLSLGETNKHVVASLADELLVDRQELVPLHKHARKPITSIAYVSESFMKEVGAADRQIDNLAMMAEQLIPLTQLPEGLQQELVTDVRALGADIRSALPIPGAVMSFAYLSSRGYEGYTYNWAQNTALDGTKRLSILDNLGSDPLMFYAARGKSSPEQYDLLAKWVRRAGYYFNQIAREELDSQERQLYDKLRPDLLSLGRRLDRVMREQFLPALEDQQSAIVVDARSTSRQWHVALPESRQPLPMLELAVVHGMSDAVSFRQGCVECFTVVQDLLSTLHAAAPEEVPEIDLPRPSPHEVPSGWIYSYTLPPPWGFDAQIAPNMGWSDKVVALALMPAHTERLLSEAALEGKGPLAHIDRPLAAAASCNWAELIGFVEAWIDYAVDQWVGAGGGDASAEDASVKSVKDQIHAGLSILKCLRGVASVTYFENDVQVTHFEWHLADLKEQ